MREMMEDILSADPGIEVVGAVCDPLAARQKIKEVNPDVLTLDIEMPRMDGIAFLDKIMTLRPMPVVMVSSLTQEGAEATLRALEAGAVDFVAKPALNLQVGMQDKRNELIAKVKAAARARVQRRAAVEAKALTAPRRADYSSTEKIVAIGASTGGVEATSQLLQSMPADCPAILLTLHMPENFTASFARRLNNTCKIRVVEARMAIEFFPVMPTSPPVAPILALDARAQITSASFAGRSASAGTVHRSTCCFTQPPRRRGRTQSASS